MSDTDVLTLDEAKAALNISASNTTQDTELARYVSAVSLRLDELVGPVVKRTITDEAHDGGRRVIELAHAPVASITTLLERSGGVETTLVAEDFAAATANDFVLDARAGLVWRRGGLWDRRFAAGRRNIIVTYDAGRFDDTASVTEEFKLGAAMLLTHLWRREQGMTAEGVERIPTYAVPNAVRELLAAELPGPVVG